MKVVHGDYDSTFESVVETFANQDVARVGCGSSLAVFKDGVPVINVWQGEAKINTPWTKETVSTVFSCTKGLAAVLVAHLQETAVLDLDDQVSSIWPEFAAKGKEAITIRQVMQHRAGLSAPRSNITHEQALDARFVAQVLAEQEPLWRPDSSNGYHALTYGYLVGEIVLRATGLTIGDLLERVIAEPLGIPMWIGVPQAKLPLVATLTSDGNFTSSKPAEFSNGYWLERAMTLGAAFPNDPTDANGYNDSGTLQAEIAGAGGVTNAFGLAKAYSALVTETDGVRLASDSTIRDFLRKAAPADNFWQEPVPFPKWAAGFMLPLEGVIEMPGIESFGHNGLGGQAGWASIDQRVGFGYTTTFLKNTPETQRNQQELVRELNRVLAQG